MELKKSNAYLVHIIEHSGDYPHIYRVTKSLHLAKALLHEYIANLESHYRREDIIIKENEFEILCHPTLKEVWNIKIKTLYGDYNSVTCEIHQIKEYSI
jgi:hypothetical protein